MTIIELIDSLTEFLKKNPEMKDFPVVYCGEECGSYAEADRVELIYLDVDRKAICIGDDN
jgi:hypothetical protein